MQVLSSQVGALRVVCDRQTADDIAIVLGRDDPRERILALWRRDRDGKLDKRFQPVRWKGAASIVSGVDLLGAPLAVTVKAGGSTELVGEYQPYFARLQPGAASDDCDAVD